MANQETVLIVDDDERYRERLARSLAERGLNVLQAADSVSATAQAQTHAIDFAAIDLRMPGPSGLLLLTELKKIQPNTRVVVVTGYGSIATATEAIRLGATHYVTKPVDVDDLLVAFAKGFSPPAANMGQVPSLARVEWEHINRVLADCGGNISQAARLLRIERRSLQRKLAKFPVREE